MQDDFFKTNLTNLPYHTQAASAAASNSEAADITQASRNDIARLESSKKIVLLIQDTPLHLPLKENVTLLVGRIDPRTKLRPDIDLTPYGGAEQGVSRNHCTLLYKNNLLSVTDLGSSYGTYVNERRLQPNRSVALNTGDVLLVGQLRIQVTLPTS